MGKPQSDELRPDIAAAKDRMSTKVGGGREIKRLGEHLWEGEVVEAMATGLYGKGNGLVVLTDRRLLFTFDGLMSQATEDFPFERTSSVQWASGLAMGSITIFAGGAKAEIKSVPKRDGKAIVDAARARLSAGSAPAVPAQSAAPDVMSQLEQLGKLRDAGVLTVAEFDEKKAQLLARL